MGSYHDGVCPRVSRQGTHKNNLDGYRYIVQNFAQNDKIYLFGFGQGAHTVRALSGLINNCGISKRAEIDGFVARIQRLIEGRGWGLWAVEVPGVSDFIGFVGLHMPKDHLPCSPCVEIGWRLAKPYWGKGYAREAATAALDYAFTELQLDEVLSFTAVADLLSQAVMKLIGMTDTSNNFMHPDI